ncbi:MAG: DUF4249 domain-containing protein [Chitinophagaceae bacterium]
MRCFLSFLFLLTLFGCEKAVDFKLEAVLPRLVVEATIETGLPPRVVLSRSLNYFSKITPEILAESFVHGAVIKVSNGTSSHILKEYKIALARDYSLYYYSVDSSTLATAFVGELGKSYAMTLQHEAKEYKAVTTIPAQNKRIDSIWWKRRTGDTSEVSVLLKVTDPKGFGNYVRYFTRKNREPFLPGFTSVYDDLVIEGTTYELEVEPGVDRNGTLKGERNFLRGDTVMLQISGIDKPTYDFWRTMEYTYASVGNPFSSPIRVISNISNGALGYFGGYASQYRTIIIPR